jgi:hypothetical protein
MQPSRACQSGRLPVEPRRLRYRRGEDVVHEASLLQCDVCERFACPDCLRDTLLGYDFLCHDCAREMESTRLEDVRRWPPHVALAQNPPRGVHEPERNFGSRTGRDFSTVSGKSETAAITRNLLRHSVVQEAGTQVAVERTD